MMKQAELTNEVEQVLDDKLAYKEPAAMTWLVQEIMQRHQDIAGGDTEFFLLCGYEHVRTTVRGVLRRRREGQADPESQRRFEGSGFHYLQQSYPIDRADDQIVVPLEQMTAAEIDAKADELTRMGEGCFAHADELRQYARARSSTPTTTAA